MDHQVGAARGVLKILGNRAGVKESISEAKKTRSRQECETTPEDRKGISTEEFYFVRVHRPMKNIIFYSAA